MARCGDCRWFDGEGYLDVNGCGMGMCCVDPPVWCNPPADGYDEWVEYVMDDGWHRPMVGVAQMACKRYEWREG